MNDEKIISGIRKRDEQMLAFAMQRYSRLLWKMAAAILTDASSEQDVEECIADTFLYLWQHPEKYDPSKTKLTSWLSMVTRSRAIDRYRRIMKRKEISSEEIVIESLGAAGIPAYANESSFDDRADKLTSCFRKLDEKERELLIRRYDEEQKISEIAIAMELSKKQVENKLYQVKRKLKKLMESE